MWFYQVPLNVEPNMSYSLKELLDVSRLRQLLDYLDEISSMPSAILDTEGNVLTASGWQDICTKFHRVNPDTHKKCIESDRRIEVKLSEAPQHVVYRCPMGLVDAAVPVVIDGEHLGNVFTGQLFLEPPDEAFFVMQARQYGFDEDEYLAAMRKVPVVPEGKLHKYLDLIHGFTVMLAEQGLQSIRQKQAEEALKISEERFRSLIERIPNIAIQGYRLDGSVSFWNRASEMLYGYSAEETLGANLLDLIIPETMRGFVEGAIKQMVVTGESIPASELMLKRKDGSLVPVFSSHALLKSGEDQAELFCLDIDLTERKKAEEVIRQEQLFSNKLLDSLPGIFYLYTYPELRLIRWNKQHETLLGYESGEIEGRHLLEWHVPEVREAVKDAVDMGMEQGQNSVEAWLLAKDGHRVPFILTGVGLELQGKRYLMGIGIDITERKKAEDALSYSIALTNAALESTADAILVVNRKGEIVQWNQKFVDLWQVPEHLLVRDVKDPVLEYVSAQFADPEAFVSGVMALYEHPEDSSEDTLILADGRFFERYSQPLKIGDEIVGRFWSFRDVTDRKEHEREQLKIEKLESLGILAGGIAHDFNNILTAVIGNISLAQMFLEPTHRAFKQLLEAEKASVRATELSHQLLTFARGGEPLKKVVSLRPLVDESISLVLHGSNVKGVVDIPESIPAIEADEGQLSQVFHNIIINATQAMPGGGKIFVTARNEQLQSGNSMELQAGNYVKLIFADQGCGISETDLARIFDPYFTTKSSGNGLGLASAHSIIKRHGGHISASSVLAKGTTFNIYLPSVEETYADYRSESEIKIDEKHRGGMILVMDDEKMILELISDMLDCLGYAVKTCENGEEAVSLYKKQMEKEEPFSMVIMDLTIPGGMGGKEAAEQILAIDPKACLVVSSGYSSDPIVSSFSSYGFKAAVAKPYRLKEISQVLSSLL